MEARRPLPPPPLGHAILRMGEIINLLNELANVFFSFLFCATILLPTHPGVEVGLFGMTLHLFASSSVFLLLSSVRLWRRFVVICFIT